MVSLARNSRLPRQDLRKSERRRLALALCASVFAHYCLLAIGPGGSVVRLPAQLAPGGITARLVSIPARDSEALARDASARPRVVPRDDGATAAVAVQRLPVEKPMDGGMPRSARSVEKWVSISPAASLAAAVDTTWYGAQDIDTYPRSAVPLRLAPPPGISVARLLLWLRIDEQGEVVEVSAGEAGIPAAWVDAARESLVSIRFAPARKDERAVRSRLLLSVSFAPVGTRD